MKPASPSTPRLQWPDIAKVLATLAVVLNHVIGKYFASLDTADWVEDLWTGLSASLDPVRMPAFFVLSGFFAARAMSRPWRASALRLATNYWVYVVWLLICFAIYSVERDLPTNRTQNLDELWIDLVWASTSLWFLWAIVAYYVIVRATMWIPAWLVIVTTATWMWFVSDLGIELHNRESTLLYLGCFVVGARAPQALEAVTRLQVPLFAVAAVFVATSVAMYEVGLSRSQETLVGSVIGVPALLLVSVRLQRTSLGDGLTRRLGGETLPIYLMHLPLLALILHLPLIYGEGDTVPASVALVWPLVLTAILVVGSVLARRLLLLVGGRSLFALPTALARRCAPSATISSAPVRIRGPIRLGRLGAFRLADDVPVRRTRSHSHPKRHQGHRAPQRPPVRKGRRRPVLHDRAEVGSARDPRGHAPW